MNKILAIMISLVTLIGMIWGVNEYLDTRYANAGEVKKLEQRLDVKIISDKLFNVQDRIWRLEDYYSGQTMPSAVKDEYLRLKNEKINLEKDLNDIKP